LSSEYCIFNWSCEVHSMHQGCTCDPAVIPRHFPSREGYQLPQRHTALQLSRKRLRHFFVDKADQTLRAGYPHLRRSQIDQIGSTQRMFGSVILLLLAEGTLKAFTWKNRVCSSSKRRG
jgi:hypothetical protein